MRFSLLVGLGAVAGACVADVGGDECVGSRCKDDKPDAGAGSATPPGCDNPEEKIENLTLRTAADFDRLPTGCWSLNGNLRLEGQAITSLAKLGTLVEVNDLELVDTALTSLDTRTTIKVWGSLLVSGNTKLANLNNLAVERWTGATQGGVAWQVGYTIRDNPALTAITGLKYIKQVDRDLRITNNAALAAIDFTELETVTGGVYLSGTGATGADLRQLKTVGRIEITSNSKLTQISGLAATSITGDVVLRSNPVLATVGSMSSLAQIGGALTIDDNDALVDLGALTGALQRIGGAVTIANNARLTGLGQLAHLTSGIGSTVTISSNPQLSYCRALEVDHCVQSGPVTIQNNLSANNCNCWCGQ